MTIGRKRILLERVKRVLTINTQGGILFQHCLKKFYVVVEEMQSFLRAISKGCADKNA